MQPTKLKIADITMKFRTRRGAEVVAVDDLSLEVADREFVSIVGPSGCGKSTLLAVVGRGLAQRAAYRRAGRRSRHGLSVVYAVSLAYGAGKCRVWLAAESHGRPAAGARRGRVYRDGRVGGLRASLSERAVRRYDAARRARAGARQRPGCAVDGRAFRGARRPDTDHHAGIARRLVAAHSQDDYLCHPRYRRGDLPEPARVYDDRAARADQTDARREPAAPTQP